MVSVHGGKASNGEMMLRWLDGKQSVARLVEAAVS